MYQAILFDMDGTVVDTEGIWHVAAEHILQRREISLTDEQRQELRRNINGQSLSGTCLYLNMWLSEPASASQLMHELVDAAQTYYAEGVSYIPGFQEFHAKLAQHNLDSALVTNADRYMLNMTDRALDLRQFFGSHMYCVDDVSGASKPSPNLYQYAAQQLGITPQDTIVIEDSSPGVQAAITSGAYCIGINTGGDHSQLEQAHIVVNSYEEIDLDALMRHV